MKYILIDMVNGDMFTEEFNTADEAVKAGERAWNRLSAYDQERREVFAVIESVNPDEDAEDHFDGTPVKEWK